MFFRFMHTTAARAIRVALGMTLIGASILRDVTVAFPLVIGGSLLVVTAIADISVLEVLFKACGGEVDQTAHRHA